MPRWARWCFGMWGHPAAEVGGPTPPSFPHTGLESTWCPGRCGFGPRHVDAAELLVQQDSFAGAVVGTSGGDGSTHSLVPDDALPGTDSISTRPSPRHSPWAEACACFCCWLRCRGVDVISYKYITKRSGTSGIAAVPTRRRVHLPRGIGCGPYSILCEMSRKPWVPCHLIMYAVMIVMVAVVCWAATDANVEIGKVIDATKLPPGEFYVRYLVDVQSDPRAECPSTAGAACFCYPGDG